MSHRYRALTGTRPVEDHWSDLDEFAESCDDHLVLEDGLDHA